MASSSSICFGRVLTLSTGMNMTRVISYLLRNLYKFCSFFKGSVATYAMCGKNLIHNVYILYVMLKKFANRLISDTQSFIKLPRALFWDAVFARRWKRRGRQVLILVIGDRWSVSWASVSLLVYTTKRWRRSSWHQTTRSYCYSQQPTFHDTTTPGNLHASVFAPRLVSRSEHSTHSAKSKRCARHLDMYNVG